MIHDDDGPLLCRVRRGGRRQSQDMQVVYARQVLRRIVPKKALAKAQESMQTTCRRTTR